MVRALLPDLIKFAYIPQHRLRIHGGRDSPDFSAFAQSSLGIAEKEEHVLILEFTDKSRGKKSGNPA
jgi:DEAD/DEAH box helicase domain-containing protein